MTAFWIAAGVLLAGALGFLLVPLTRKQPGRSGVTRDAINVSVYRDQLRELDVRLSGVDAEQACRLCERWTAEGFVLAATLTGVRVDVERLAGVLLV